MDSGFFVQCILYINLPATQADDCLTVLGVNLTSGILLYMGFCVEGKRRKGDAVSNH